MRSGGASEWPVVWGWDLCRRRQSPSGHRGCTGAGSAAVTSISSDLYFAYVANREINAVQSELDDLFHGCPWRVLAKAHRQHTTVHRRIRVGSARAHAGAHPRVYCGRQPPPRVAEAADGGAHGSDLLQTMPPEINRFFFTSKQFSKGTPLTIRQVKASNIA